MQSSYSGNIYDRRNNYVALQVQTECQLDPFKYYTANYHKD